MSNTEDNFKPIWPHTDAPHSPDLDLKRPGRIDAQTRASVLRGAVAGPPARPGGKSD